jgi:hypothetical protein
MSATKNPYNSKTSLPSRFRRRRFAAFRIMIDAAIAAHGRCHILDLGGTDYYWNLQEDVLSAYGDKLHIYLVNLEPPPTDAPLSSRYTVLTGDCTLAETYSMVDYDLIHSNSVIEHVGSWGKITQMTDCIIASGKPYFVQTPNHWFPLEPHFRFVGWQYLPESWRAWMLTKRSIGFFPKAQSYAEAIKNVEDIKLLTSGQMKILFPRAQIMREWFGPFVKSFVAVDRKTHASH